MRRSALLCACCCASLAGPAMASDLVAYLGPDVVRLTAQACTSPAVLAHIAPELQPNFHMATAMLDGQRYQACWHGTPTAAYLIYEDGDQGLVLLQDLKVPVDI
jgi:hypothetical protein